MSDIEAAPARILVIKHGALGDFVMALGPMQAIRRHHSDAQITLLTTPPFEALARASGYVGDIWTDTRPRWREPGKLIRLACRLRARGFDRVYDLQTSQRSSLYFRFFACARRPEWSGIARGCSHPDDNPERSRIHTIERQRGQLNRAGIADVPPPSLDWITGEPARFGLAAEYALLVPGGAAHRPRKRWPIEGYAALAVQLEQRGLQPVVLGGEDERDLAAAIRAAAPGAISLAGKTSIMDLAVLARGARLAVGNDTGPMHVAAIAGAPSVVLFSEESDPKRTAPRGSSVSVLRREPLADLAVTDVAAAVDGLLSI